MANLHREGGIGVGILDTNGLVVEPEFRAGEESPYHLLQTLL
jgi:hypothetical protein